MTPLWTVWTLRFAIFPESRMTERPDGIRYPYH